MGCALQVASLIMQRNVLAARLGRKRSLPPMLQDAHACSGCFQVTNCALLHKVTCCRLDSVHGCSTPHNALGPAAIPAKTLFKGTSALA